MKPSSILTILIILGLTFVSDGQDEVYLKEVKWEKYKDSEVGISFVFPKLPVLLNSSNRCEQLESKTYYSYAEGAVYSVAVYSKAQQPVPDYCTSISNFGREAFDLRVNSLTKKLTEAAVEKLKIKDRDTIKFTKSAAEYWIIEDLKNNRWMEISVSSRAASSSQALKLLDSLELTGNSEGVEISEGAARVFGDITYESQNALQKNTNDASIDSKNSAAVSGNSPNAPDSQNDPILIVYKPAAKYTEAARQAETQGNVILRVTFLASGGIGQISPVNELPDGLTEEAIKAARKIAFLPGRKNKIPLTFVKQVQYNFSLYRNTEINAASFGS